MCLSIAFFKRSISADWYIFSHVFIDGPTSNAYKMYLTALFVFVVKMAMFGTHEILFGLSKLIDFSTKSNELMYSPIL